VSSCAGHARDLDTVAKPAPQAPPSGICDAIEAAPPLQGGIPQPTTVEAQDAVQMFLGATAELFGWGGRGWARAAKAKERYCP